MKSILLSTAYLAPIQYFVKLIKYGQVYVEVHENFIKQSYRNRCKIYGANGEMSLSIPVKKVEPKTKIKDVKIDYDTNWRKVHWKSIESAYRSSPFFEFYQDDFIPFYKDKYSFLLDFNLELQKTVMDLLEIDIEMLQTNDYISNQALTEAYDMREEIHPKKVYNDPGFKVIEYPQVFQQKYGFIPNLSIVDLLFNEGPNAIEILKNS